METGLRVISVQSKFGCILHLADRAQETHAASVVLGFAIELKGFLNDALRFEILSPPLVERGLTLADDELLKSVNHIQLGKHPGDLAAVRATFYVVFDSEIYLTDGLIVFRHLVVRVFEVDAVELGCHFHSFLELTVGLVQLAE